VASVHKKRGSKFWHAAFTLPDGRRTFRSTKETDKSRAIQVGLQWEKASRRRVAKDQAQRVLADIVRIGTGDDFQVETLHKHCQRWLQRKGREVGIRSKEKYQDVVDSLTGAFPSEMKMADVTTKQLADLRDDIAARVSLGKANFFRKIVRSIFQDAMNTGTISENPAATLTALNDAREKAERVARRPFRLDEVEAILDVLPREDEWHGMVLFGVYTGQRLRDIAEARFEQIRDGVWSFRSGKTSLDMRVALAMPILKWLGGLARSAGHIFPEQAKAAQSSVLSNRFYRIMAQARLVPHRNNQKKEGANGRAGKRVVNALGFHCFRHTTQTWLMEAGATRELAMAHVGHENEQTSRGYTHIGVDALRSVVEKLPVLRTKKIKGKA
jgi:integrase